MPSLKSKIESLLLVFNQPLTVEKLVTLTKAETKAVEAAIRELMAEYNQADRGVAIQKSGTKVQLVTSPDNARLVKDFIKAETTGELTRAALETLTIIAYRGPITRAALEQIRGVNCTIILRNLLIRGLVESADDKKKMQVTYSVTLDFLKYLGLHEQSELPDYEKLNSNERFEQLLNQPAPPATAQS